ncbi:signal peptide peptidase SppA [Luteimonas pelagia]
MNQPSRRGPIARVAVGLWDTLNFTRRLVFNLLFLLLLVLLVAMLLHGGRPGPLLGDNTLVVAPEGRLVEQYSSDPISRAIGRAMGDGIAEVQLRDLLRTFELARDDDRIERVFLRTDRLMVSGHASLRELAAAVREVREAGKQVVAYGDYFGQGQYLLAAQADEVYLDPMGGMVLEGLSRYRQYYREGLEDKLGVDVHLFKVGEYKSAAEPYVLDAASDEAKEADLFWMNDVWQRYLADVAAARGIRPAALQAGIANIDQGVAAAGGDLAKFALDQKLVDGLKTLEEIDAMLAERGTADEDAPGGYRQVDMGDYLLHHARPVATDVRPQVAVVVAEGAITSGEQPPGTVGGESTSQLLREAREDEQVKSVVLRVNSPGGEVFPSEQIRREVVALQAAGKPVVVSMGDVAASGGYWISMDADRIYADPSTITGSIGIFGLFPTVPRALDKFGIHTDGVGTTPIAGAFDITRPLDPKVGSVVQSAIEHGYRQFIGKVADARERTPAQVDEVGRGRVWSGAQAEERGLVDAMGGLRTAIADAAGRVELEDGDYRVRYIERGGTPFERFFMRFAESRVGAAWLRESGLARGLVETLAPQARDDLKFLEHALSRAPGRPVTSLAYCFCGF